MKCPICKKEIDYVDMITKSLQKGYLNGTELLNVEHLETIEIIKVKCPLCKGDLTRRVIN